MFYDQNELMLGLSVLRKTFGSWNPNKLSLVSIGENHLVEGKNFLGWLRTSDPVQNVILDVLEQHAIKSEAIGVNSGVDVVRNVLCPTRKLKDFSTLEREMSRSRYPRSGDFEKMIFERFEEKYRELLLNILKLAETDGNIFLKREHVVKTILEKMDGYVFNLESPLKVNFDERNVKCFIIDGFIESVGEIHHILESMSKDSVPGIIFARNFANDVISTLQHNKVIGRMNVLPIQVKFDFEDLNTLVDLAMISAGDLVSSDKGDLIRTISADSAPKLERVIYKNGKLVIVNPKTVQNVKRHLKNLQKRATDSTDEVRRKMIEARMATLSTNCLKVSIPLGKHYDDVESVVDSFLRIVRACLLFGVVEVDGTVVPVPTYISSYVFTRKFEKTLSESSLAGFLSSAT